MGKIDLQLPQAEALRMFWDNFGGYKSDGYGYDEYTKLSLLQAFAEIGLPRNDHIRKTRRRRFNEVKFRRHPNHRHCFVCRAEPNVRHHILQLQNEGSNTARNIVSLCNGCHAKVHPWLK